MTLDSLAQTCEAVAATSRKSEKIRLVADYLRRLDPDDATLAAVFLTGRPFARREESTLSVGGSFVWQAVARLSGAADQELSAIYRRHGDLGEVAAEALASKGRGEAIPLRELERLFRELAARRDGAGKAAIVEATLGRAGPLAAKYFAKIITGDMRIGLKENLVEEAIALAWSRPLAEVQRANMLAGDVGVTLGLAAAGRLAEAKMSLFHPLGSMLASPADAAGELADAFPAGALTEDKYDGIRAQAHKSGERVRLFSRTLDELVEFEELANPLRRLAGEFVLDGEILGWRDGRPLPFTELQKRLGRKHPELFLPLEVPVAFVAFDLLYQDGQLLLDSPLAERRVRLEHLVAGSPGGADPAVRLSAPVRCASAEEFQAAFEAALDRGNEGLMAKDPASPYTPGRRGRFWLKLKRPFATLDVVVTAVEYGHGKRHGVLSDYTFSVRDGERLVTIGKAYSGLTDAEIRELTEYFKGHTLEDTGFQRTVEPTVVMEVAFNNIQRSNRHESGYALRFPRIVRLRPEKPVAEVDTLARVAELYAQKAHHPLGGA